MTNGCKECKYCFPSGDHAYICTGDDYGKNITNSLDGAKKCYSESLEAFIERNKKLEVPFIPGTTLNQLKLDGGKYIELTDQEGKIVRIKGSKAKQMLGEIEIQKRIFNDAYKVNAIFDPEAFNSGNLLIIK